MTIPFRNKGLRKNIDYFLELKSRNPNLKYEDTLEGYKQYMSDRLSGAIDASGNTIYNSGEASNIPTSLFTQNNIGDNLEENETEKFAYRFGDDLYGAADVTQGSYIFNQGGRVPRNMGGIMNAVPRQGYFLGGIGKAIKGVVGGVADAAKKVLKSDVGKLAIAGLGA